MPFSSTDRVEIKKAYNIENSHLDDLLKRLKEAGKVEHQAIQGSKIKRAIFVYVLNGDKEKAQHKLSKFIQHCQEVMEDMLEDRGNWTFVSVDEDGTKETLKMEKDGPYKVMCDHLMEDTKIMKHLVDLI